TLQADTGSRAAATDLSRLYVRNATGGMVPLSTLGLLKPIVGPETVPHYNNYASALVNGGPAPGYSSGQAVTAMERAAATARRRQEGLSIVDAAMEAARLRLRPILMTAFAFILGVIPLMVANGAGAASRQSIGTTVFGGMLAATILTLLFVPVFYAVIETWREGAQHKSQPTPVPAPRAEAAE